MTVDVNKLIGKINFARTSKLLKDRGMIEEHFSFPANNEEEAEAVKRMIYHFLKKRFVGCKLRANSLTFSLRLDGETHKKVKKVKDKVLNDPEWKKWFQENHREILRTIERHGNPFHGQNVEVRQKDGREFIYVPIQTNRIYQYQTFGLMEMLTFLDQSYTREANVANLYDQVVTLMEGEVRRREDETRTRIANDGTDYGRRIKQNLLKAITRVNPTGTTFEDKLEARMHAWCVENGIEPAWAFEPTFDRVVPIGINVDIIVQNEDTDEGWLAVPTFGGYEMPEGYQLLEGYGDVTAHETNGRRARDGANPIVVMKHMYLQYKEELWKNHFPPRYFEILEATRRIAEEVKVEVAQAEEQRQEIERRERAERQRREMEEMQARLERQLQQQREREQRDRQAMEQAEQTERAERERLARLREQLMGQLTQAQEAERQAEPNPATFENGIYRNARAIPLERYVTVIEGRVRRFMTRTNAIDHMRANGHTWAQLGEMNVRDYDDVQTVVENIEV